MALQTTLNGVSLSKKLHRTIGMKVKWAEINWVKFFALELNDYYVVCLIK